MSAIAAAWICASGVAPAQEREITVGASPELISSGLLKYVLPRFSLKTGIRAIPAGLAASADVLIAPEDFAGGGEPALSGSGTVYFVRSTHESMDMAAATYADRFIDWLTSDVGKRTIDSFEVDGGHPFAATESGPEALELVELSGDAAAGERLAAVHCGHCHVVGDANRFSGIGSTPSFGVLRAMEDWETRFRAFYFLNPHPAFTQIEDVTEPFDEARPSPIAPIMLTLEDVEAILAYVVAIPASSLGAPIQHQ